MKRGVAQRLERHERQEEAFDPLVAQGGEQPARVDPIALVDQHQGSAAAERRGDLLERHVKRQRTELKRSPSLEDAGVSKLPVDQVVERGPSQGHTLGLAGRS